MCSFMMLIKVFQIFLNLWILAFNYVLSNWIIHMKKLICNTLLKTIPLLEEILNWCMLSSTFKLISDIDRFFDINLDLKSCFWDELLSFCKSILKVVFKFSKNAYFGCYSLCFERKAVFGFMRGFTTLEGLSLSNWDFE